MNKWRSDWPVSLYTCWGCGLFSWEPQTLFSTLALPAGGAHWWKDTLCPWDHQTLSYDHPAHLFQPPVIHSFIHSFSKYSQTPKGPILVLSTWMARSWPQDIRRLLPSINMVPSGWILLPRNLALASLCYLGFCTGDPALIIQDKQPLPLPHPLHYSPLLVWTSLWGHLLQFVHVYLFL